jgi:hypothetical protein
VELDTSSTATVSEDYINNLPVTINFASGESSKTVSIPLVGDTIVEPDEQINLKLVNPVGRGILGSQPTASFTIINDDILPTVSIAVRDELALETGNNPATFRISRAGESRGNLTVNLALATIQLNLATTPSAVAAFLSTVQMSASPSRMDKIL